MDKRDAFLEYLEESVVKFSPSEHFSAFCIKGLKLK
jgi:hypothetical protein